MLLESKLYSFLDNQNSYSIHFLEGQKLIYDIALLHELKNAGFSYYRELLLAIGPLISLLKRGESFGFYLDSESPYFRFKLEASSSGNFRTLLLPDNFNEFPDKSSGVVRFSKFFHNITPYTSLMKIDQKSFVETINQLLIDSYQIQSNVIVSDIVDQSLMFMKIPRENVGRYITDPGISLSEFEKKYKSSYKEIFELNLTDEADIVKFFTDKNLIFLGTRTFNFSCPCNKDRMVDNIRALSEKDLEELFHPHGHFEMRCDYCKKTYTIIPNDLKSEIIQ